MPLGHLRQDHRPALMDLTLQRRSSDSGGARGARRGAVSTSRELQRPELQDAVAAAAGRLPQPSWSASVHDHCALLTGAMRAAVQTANGDLPTLPSGPRAGHLQERTKEALAAERALDKHLCTCRRHRTATNDFQCLWRDLDIKTITYKHVTLTRARSCFTVKQVYQKQDICTTDSR